MKKNRKIRLRKFIVSILRGKWSDLIHLILIIAIVIPLLLVFQLNIFDHLKFDIVVSVSVTLVIGVFIKVLLSMLEASLEDANKLTIDYNKLVSKYIKDLKLDDEINKEKKLDINQVNELRFKAITNKNNSLVVYHYNQLSKKNIKELSSCNLYSFDINGKLIKTETKDKSSFYIFPVFMYYLNTDRKELLIKDSTKMYKLPSFVEKNFNELLSAHSHSNIFNSLTIRLKDLVIDDKSVTLVTERTTFYNTLVTNRSIDYKLSKNVSVREMFEFGSQITPLSNSQLSNHIGFQVIVETSDNYIIFIYRSNKVSVAKSTISCSVSSSLKTKYTLKKDDVFTIDGLRNGILKEAEDELGLVEEDFENFSMNENIVSFYGDLVEGGKPHFVFYLKSNKDKEYIRNSFLTNSKNSVNKNQMRVDGNKIHFTQKDSLKDMYISPDFIELNGKLYDTTPSTTASIVMFINYIRINRIRKRVN